MEKISDAYFSLIEPSVLVIPVISRSQLPNRTSSQEMLKSVYFAKKCLPFLEDVFSKFQKNTL